MGWKHVLIVAKGGGGGGGGGVNEYNLTISPSTVNGTPTTTLNELLIIRNVCMLSCTCQRPGTCQARAVHFTSRPKHELYI